MSIARDLAKLRTPVQVENGGTGNNGTLSTLASDVNWDTLIKSGVFFIPTASGASRPVTTGTTINYVVEVVNTPNGLKQTATLYGTPQSFSRSVSAGSWQPWYKTYDNNALVGVVTQTNGLPTGAVIERGTNGGLGSYTKYADGTMICTNRYSGNLSINIPYGSLFYGDFPTLTFPQTFVGAIPSVVMQSSVAGGGVWHGKQVNPSLTTTGSTIIMSPISRGATDVTMEYIAFGRWF